VAHWAARAHSDDARGQAEALASEKAAQEAQARDIGRFTYRAHVDAKDNAKT